MQNNYFINVAIRFLCIGVIVTTLFVCRFSKGMEKEADLPNSEKNEKDDSATTEPPLPVPGVIEAAKNGDLKIMKTLLGLNLGISMRDANGYQPLHHAVDSSYIRSRCTAPHVKPKKLYQTGKSIIRLLLHRNAPVNDLTTDGHSPLSLLFIKTDFTNADNRHWTYQVAKILLKHDANTHQKIVSHEVEVNKEMLMEPSIYEWACQKLDSKTFNGTSDYRMAKLIKAKGEETLAKMVRVESDEAQTT